MTGTPLRVGIIVVATLLTLIVAPRVSQAWLITCHNNFDAYQCNDGTIVTCSGANGPFDCPAEGEIAMIGCADHGGIRTILQGGVSQQAELIADYKGGQSVPPYTGAKPVSSLVVTTLRVTCSNGRQVSCVEPQMSCGPAQLQARCGGAPVRSLEALFAFTPFRR